MERRKVFRRVLVGDLVYEEVVDRLIKVGYLMWLVREIYFVFFSWF